MATIKEDYVSFETAKLLKEKGFNAEIDTYYSTEGEFKIWCPNERKSYLTNDGNETWWWKCIAPSQSMAMKWLREVHHVEISITFGFPFIDVKQQYKYFWSVVKVCNNHLEFPMDDTINATYNEEIADSYEQAVEAGIKYCLKNLI